MENKKYSIIYAHPPLVQDAEPLNLHEHKTGKKHLPYSFMTLDEIKNLNVKNIIDDNAVLFLWTTNRHIEDAYCVARSWGFNPSTMLVWCKKPKGRGLGGTFGISTEYMLFSRKGTFKAKDRHWSTWFEAPRREHSRKPDIARDIIDKCFEGNKIELFARERILGWHSWGNEVESDIELLPKEKEAGTMI